MVTICGPNLVSWLKPGWWYLTVSILMGPLPVCVPTALLALHRATVVRPMKGSLWPNATCQDRWENKHKCLCKLHELTAPDQNLVGSVHLNQTPQRPRAEAGYASHPLRWQSPALSGAHRTTQIPRPGARFWAHPKRTSSSFKNEVLVLYTYLEIHAFHQ